MMTPAGGEHGWVIMNISAPLALFVKKHHMGYVFGAETGFIIQRDPDSVRAPDVAFVRTDRVPTPLPVGFFEGPPDLAVEVLSPSDSASAVDEKAEDWLMAGCQEVWLIDPRRKVASQCTWSDGAVIRRPVARLSSGLLPGFELAVEELFQR
jgi:Uma2 family endonuclease